MNSSSAFTTPTSPATGAKKRKAELGGRQLSIHEASLFADSKPRSPSRRAAPAGRDLPADTSRLEALINVVFNALTARLDGIEERAATEAAETREFLGAERVLLQDRIAAGFCEVKTAIQPPPAPTVTIFEHNLNHY